MTDLTITLTLTYLVAVVAVALAPHVFRCSPETTTGLRWALAIMVCAPVALGVWMLTRQHDERVRTFSAMPSREVEHVREDKGIEATIEKLREAEEHVDSARREERTDAGLGSDMARRLGDE